MKPIDVIRARLTEKYDERNKVTNDNYLNRIEKDFIQYMLDKEIDLLVWVLAND